MCSSTGKEGGDCYYRECDEAGRSNHPSDREEYYSAASVIHIHSKKEEGRMAFEQRRMELVKGTVDANRAFAHTKYWVEEIGNRLDGTPGQKLAADYAKRFW